MEEAERAKEEAEKREKYERYMEYMMIELCEATVLLLYPWVFKDEQGRMRDKLQSPPYTELVQDLFKQCYDMQEELRIQLTEELIEKIFVESNVEVTEEMILGARDKIPVESEIIARYIIIVNVNFNVVISIIQYPFKPADQATRVWKSDWISTRKGSR